MPAAGCGASPMEILATRTWRSYSFLAETAGLQPRGSYGGFSPMRAPSPLSLAFVLVSALSLASGAFAQAPTPAPPAPAQKPVFERYTEPIQIFANGLGTFSRP